MMKDKELLEYVHKTADMGCEGILSVVEYVEDGKLRQVLQKQLEDYRRLRDEAAGQLRAQGEEPEGSGTMAKVSAEVMSAGKLLLDRSASRIAEMTIQGTSMGVSRTIQHLNDFEGDGPARSLARRLLAVEEACVEELKAFL